MAGREALERASVYFNNATSVEYFSLETEPLRKLLSLENQGKTEAILDLEFRDVTNFIQDFDFEVSDSFEIFDTLNFDSLDWQLIYDPAIKNSPIVFLGHQNNNPDRTLNSAVGTIYLYREFTAKRLKNASLSMAGIAHDSNNQPRILATAYTPDGIINRITISVTDIEAPKPSIFDTFDSVPFAQSTVRIPTQLQWPRHTAGLVTQKMTESLKTSDQHSSHGLHIYRGNSNMTNSGGIYEDYMRTFFGFTLTDKPGYEVISFVPQLESELLAWTINVPSRIKNS